jgi:DnaJ-class molecular chaperone
MKPYFLFPFLLDQTIGFGFEDLFEHAFGGGGGFQFQMGGRPRAAQFPHHIKNEISDDFSWLKGTEWMLNDRVVVKFAVEGFVQTNTQECAGPQQCIYSAYDGQINMAFLQSGLFTVRPDKKPESADASALEKVRLYGRREADRGGVNLRFVRIYDMRSREDAIDLYALLGVEPDATIADIKKTFRRLTVDLHPDKNPGDPTAASRFTEVSRAAEILSDNTKRMLYDTGGMEAIRAFDRGEVQKGQDILFEITVPLSLLFTGGTVAPTYQRRVVCVGCRANPNQPRCRGCSRCPSEIRTVAQQVGPGFFVQQQVQVDSKEWCKTEDKALEVTISKGMKNGDDIVMEAMADQRPGMVPGNVVVRLKQLPDAKFVREGNDLKTSITVSLREALLGFRKDIGMPDGSIVPVVTNAVTQPNQVIKITGEGMPIKDESSNRGDLVVTIIVQLPQILTNDQKQSIGQIFENNNVRGDEL